MYSHIPREECVVLLHILALLHFKEKMGMTCLGSTLTFLKLTVIIDDSYLCLSNVHYGVRGIERGVVDSHIN